MLRVYYVLSTFQRTFLTLLLCRRYCWYPFHTFFFSLQLKLETKGHTNVFSGQSHIASRWQSQNQNTGNMTLEFALYCLTITVLLSLYEEVSLSRKIKSLITERRRQVNHGTKSKLGKSTAEDHQTKVSVEAWGCQRCRAQNELALLPKQKDFCILQQGQRTGLSRDNACCTE